eukprot:1137054-Pelagomonas_calceolata.AAC.2
MGSERTGAVGLLLLQTLLLSSRPVCPECCQLHMTGMGLKNTEAGNSGNHRHGIGMHRQPTQETKGMGLESTMRSTGMGLKSAEAGKPGKSQAWDCKAQRQPTQETKGLGLKSA